MIALTARLNERDETIIQLQEELDAYDRIHREAEQVVEFKQHRVFQLESFIRDQCKTEPPQSQVPDEAFFSVGGQGKFVQHASLAERRYPPHNS